MKAGSQCQSLLDDGHEHVDRHRNPDLSFDGILAIAVECLDSQVLFDPSKEQFTCQRDLYSRQTVRAGRSKLLVRKRRLRSCSVS